MFKANPPSILGKSESVLNGAKESSDKIKIINPSVDGFTQRNILHGHTERVNRIAWSPNGKYLASPSTDATVRIWSLSSGECIQILEGHRFEVNCVSWSTDGSRLSSGSADGNIIIWDTKTWKVLSVLKEHKSLIYVLTWAHGKNTLASGSADGSIVIWDTSSGEVMHKHEECQDWILSLAWSPSTKMIAVGPRLGRPGIRIWNATTWKEVCTLKLNEFRGATNILWPTENIIISAHQDGTIKTWDVSSRKLLQSAEGHTQGVSSISISKSNKLLASKSVDNTVRIWSSGDWREISTLPEQNFFEGRLRSGLAFNPAISNILATLGENDTAIRIWELDEDFLLNQGKQNVHYTTAKLVLVGDSGVGKTGLGWRLAHNEFKEHASTHGQQFWPLQQLNLKRNDGTDCEAVLWDLAGQHVYRQVHSIFLENVAAALILFDPTNRQDPLKGARFWLEQLKGKGNLPPAVLVGARVDRGSPTLSQDELDQFCQQYGIKGGYLSTSAKAGDGLPELLETLKEQIPWDGMAATVTTFTFKRIKDYVLSLKEKTDLKSVLVSSTELRKLLEEAYVNDDALEEWSFTEAEMMTAIGHLDTHGYVSVLRDSCGEQTILLTPETLVNLAASIMLLADKNPHELGAVSETELLQGKYDFEELNGLVDNEAQTLLDAAVLRFIEHNICFRDTLNDDTLLIFPSLINQKRPLEDDTPTTDDISFIVRGRVENLYASLVVLLGHTPTFSRLHQWQSQAQYEMREGGICGFRAIEEREGELEMVLYYGDDMSPQGREKFHELFEQFLYQREVEVTPFPPVICAEGHPIERVTVIKRVKEGKDSIFCGECGIKTMLPDLMHSQSTIAKPDWLQLEEAMAHLRSTYEGHLTRVKGYRRGWATPRAYLSYLPAQKDWVKMLVEDLHDAGVYIVDKANDLKAEDFVIILNTSAYKQAFQNLSSILDSDVYAIRSRLGSNKLVSIDCEGKLSGHSMEQCPTGDFSDKTHYGVSLFNLVLELYAIPHSHKVFEPLRDSLHQQWESTLSKKEIMETSSALKIFISYSHKDEEFKDELVTMLAGLQRRKIVDAWQDRRIEVGDDWSQSIETAMNECDLAVLLVSPDYLASDFIQEKEQPRFLQRRKDLKAKIIPIIVRPCMWLSEPELSAIQSLPRDNKAVITFSKDNGERDEVWTAIAQEIAKRSGI